MTTESSFKELEQIYNSARTAIAMSSLDGRYLQVNQKFCEIFGYTSEELSQKNFLQLSHPEESTQALAWIDEFKSGRRRSLDARKRYLHKQGHLLWIRILVNGVWNPAGELEAFVTVLEDVTEQKAAEDLLRKQKEVLELMLKDLPLSDTLSRIVQLVEEQAPGALSTIYLIEDGKLMVGAAPSFPASFTQVVHGCPIGPTAGSCGAAAFLGKQIVSIDIEKDDSCWGSFREWILSYGIKAAWSTPVFSRDNQVIGTVSMCWKEPKEPLPRHLELVEVATRLMGIAIERDRTRQLLESQQVKMIASSKLAALGEMAAGLAHEINNPLAIIQGRSEQLGLMIRHGQTNPAQMTEIARSIEGTTKRISRIVRGLRTFARETDGDPFVPARIETILEDTLSLCHERFKVHSIEIQQTLFDRLLELECRSVQLSQVLLNLLNNAHDAVIPLKDRWIRIEILDEGTELSVAVTDSGAGIPQELRERIMQPFFTTKQENQGTGLGLSISSGIAASHGGRLWLDSAAPNTRFVVTLPKVQRER